MTFLLGLAVGVPVGISVGLIAAGVVAVAGIAVALGEVKQRVPDHFPDAWTEEYFRAE